MPLLSPSAKKKQQKIGGVPLDLARAVLGAVFDTLDETRTGSLEVAELQRVGFKTATMVGSPSDAQVDREAFVRTIVSLLGRKNADDSAKLLPEAVALCGRVFRLRAAAAARDAADLARAEAEEKADVARYAARTRAERATTDGRRAEAAAAEGRRIADGLRGRLEAAEDEVGRVRAALRDATADAEATAAKMERLQEALAKSDNSGRVADLDQALAAANERVRDRLDLAALRGLQLALGGLGAFCCRRTCLVGLCDTLLGVVGPGEDGLDVIARFSELVAEAGLVQWRFTDALIRRSQGLFQVRDAVCIIGLREGLLQTLHLRRRRLRVGRRVAQCRPHPS